MKTIILCGGRGIRLGNEADYIPKAMIFRKNRATDYTMVEENNNPYFQSFIMVSGAVVKQTQINNNNDDNNNEDEVVVDVNNDRNEKEVYMEKIKNCMSIALFNGHDSIIFTAIGCYNNNKNHDDCTDAFLYAIFDPSTMFYRRFKSIVFWRII